MTHMDSELGEEQISSAEQHTRDDSDEAPEDLVSEVHVALPLIGMLVFVVLPGLVLLSLLW